MTTIAYKDGVIAYDSRVTMGATIMDDDYDKCQASGDARFLCSGAGSDFNALIAAYFGTPTEKEVDALAFVVDGDGLFLIGHNVGNGLWKDQLRLDRTHAIGSGSPFALTAMDMGATAAEAVEMAKKRDTSTGGLVRTLVVAEQPTAK